MLHLSNPLHTRDLPTPQISDTLAMFERNYTDLLGKLTEQAQAVFSDLREMEEETQAEVTELAIGFLEALIKGEADPDVPLTTELQELLRDKTTLTTALATAHDNHLVEIDNKEDAVVGSARKEMQTLLRDLQLKEVRAENGDGGCISSGRGERGSRRKKRAVVL